jgi:hypothetical protein
MSLIKISFFISSSYLSLFIRWDFKLLILSCIKLFFLANNAHKIDFYHIRMTFIRWTTKINIFLIVLNSFHFWINCGFSFLSKRNKFFTFNFKMIKFISILLIIHRQFYFFLQPPKNKFQKLTMRIRALSMLIHSLKNQNWKLLMLLNKFFFSLPPQHNQERTNNCLNSNMKKNFFANINCYLKKIVNTNIGAQYKMWAMKIHRNDPFEMHC